MKSCQKGYYYCNTEQKCKPIPDGYTVKDDGFLVKEDRQIKKIVKQLRKSVKSHAKQADTLEKKISESKKDHEPEMIRNQLKTAGRASKRIEKHSRKKDNFKAWVQSKITKASDYLDTAADYLDSKEVKEAANPAQQAAIAISMKKKGIKPKNLKEQIKFAQMQQRIRDAKEKRREQQKKSEKLYIDTKRKGVKFYDKKGSGRLKDGKKIYD